MHPRAVARGRAVWIGHGSMTQPNKLVDIKLVIGEQDEILKVVGSCAGVMPQSVQRVVNALSREQGQWQGLPGAWRPGAIGNPVVHGRKVRQIEHIAHELAPLGAEFALQVIVFGK